MRGSVAILFASFLFILALCPIPVIADVSPEFRAEYQRSCTGVVEAEINRHGANMLPGDITALREGNFGYEGTPKAELEERISYLPGITASLRNDPSDGAQAQANLNDFHLCGYRVALRLLQQKEQQQAQQQALDQQRAYQQELERQQALQRQAQQQALEQQRAQQQQAEAGPEEIQAEPAHECLNLIKETGVGGFNNGCDFRVHFAWCAYLPEKNTSAKFFDCAQFKAGTTGVDGAAANGNYGALTLSAEKIFWFACKAPSRPMDLEYRPYVGLYGRCG